MIELANATKHFQTDTVRTTALNDIDLTINNHEFVSIMGPSGSGKSTLLNVLGLFEALDQGSYTLDEHQVSRMSNTKIVRVRRATLGYVFQSFNLIPHLSSLENVELPLLYRGYKPVQAKSMAKKSLQDIQLGHRLNHKPFQLSGGQQQRVAIARACVSQPKLILADEPTGNLDSESGKVVLETLRKIYHNGATIVMVTHSNHAANYGTKQLTMHDGEIVEERVNTWQ
ncbi:ABC transporter ATP-binding protein [Vibrio sp. ZSDZ65]|uniref:ABC transporter ATP-binding protein n=1 Tax=Vibrio qingdaonensis TaxID=2829491 RepID=A0A9X3CT34_9VIBR|nr:ABC transporter ATP-binding protein [Vibrio qingdaonensis]MCW8348985.1 ABC transporter ATP-binding protein [Vibrio qingdaonensis]